jgi:hypothetical protein
VRQGGSGWCARKRNKDSKYTGEERERGNSYKQNELAVRQRENAIQSTYLLYSTLYSNLSIHAMQIPP